MYTNGKTKRNRVKCLKNIPGFILFMAVCLFMAACLFVMFIFCLDDDVGLRPRTKKKAFICITGQVERLELDGKISMLFEPLKRRGYEVSATFLLTEGQVRFTNKGEYSKSPFRVKKLSELYPEYVFKQIEKILNPPINIDLFKHLNKAWFWPAEQKRRAENHYRQYNTLNQCYEHISNDVDIIVRIREDAFIHRINWDEIIHKLKRSGPVIMTPSYAEWNGINDKVAFLNRKSAKIYFTHPWARYNEVHPDWIVNPETYYFYIYDDAQIFLDTVDSLELVTSRYDSRGLFHVHGVSPTELKIVEKIKYEQNPWKFVDCITVINLKTHPERAEEFLRESKRVGIPDTIQQQWEDLDPDGGTAGCFRAHVRAVQNAWNAQCDNVLVFEPDTYFIGDYQKAFRDMDNFLASGEYYDVFFLGHYPISRMHVTEYEGIYRSFSSFHGHARMISRQFMKKMRLLEYSGIHLDNQIALMRPRMLTVYPMVAFQHAHHSDVSPFKNTRSEANEDELRSKLVKAEQDAVTKGRLCYMSKTNPETRTMSREKREALCEWTRKYIWLFTDRVSEYLSETSKNLRIETSSDVQLLRNLQYRKLLPADIYIFEKKMYHSLSKSTLNFKSIYGVHTTKKTPKINSRFLPIVSHYIDSDEKSVISNLQTAIKSTVYEFPRCKSKFIVWNDLLEYRNNTIAKELLMRKWPIHPRYNAVNWSNVDWLTVKMPDQYSRMLLFSLRPLLPLYWYDKKAFDIEMWRFYTTCQYTCRHQLGPANTHAASFRIMINVLTHFSEEFLVDDVNFLLNYPKKTKNNHVLAEAMALVLAGNVLNKQGITNEGLNRFVQIFYWYSQSYHVHSDGVVDEVSPFYQLYVLDQVVQIRKYLQCWTDISLDKIVEKSMKNMALYSYATTLDQGYLFPFGTTTRRRPFGEIGQGVINEKNYLVIQDMYPIKSKSYHANKVGHWILHTSDWHIFFNYAASDFNKWHRDFDALSVIIATNKEGLWLSDPGPFARHGDKEWEAERSEHFRSTKHHNTITIDGNDQPQDSGTLVSSDQNSITATFLTHTRYVEVKDDEIMIVDTMNPQDNEMHSYQQTWHLDPDVHVEGNKLWKDQACILVESSHQLNIKQAKHSYDYHQSVPTKELIAFAYGKHTVTLKISFRKCS